jgi:hypothetical protein
MLIKKRIRITYLVDLYTDNIAQRIEEGIDTKETIMKRLKRFGVQSGVDVDDCEIESVEDIQEVK